MSEQSIESTPNPVFTETYRCAPLDNQDNKNIEKGGKLILPVSALEEINYLDIPYPLMFKVTNESNNKFTHAGVLEFTAQEGQVNIPQWMFSHLRLKRGASVRVETVYLPSATHCSLEALTRNFAYVSDTKKVLENSLRYFSCLTEGDVLFIHDKSCRPYQIYKMKISKTKPEPAVNIFECDLEVDYTIPAPKERLNNKTNSKKEEDTKSVGFEIFKGAGYRLDGEEVKSSSNTQKPIITRKTFIAFNGTGNVLQNQKRKAEDINCTNSPAKKKKTEDDELTNKPNELIFIREQQKEYLRKQSDEDSKFPGQGHSMRDN